jgi:2-C-methyl-D-erythritol 4-phosphate cytidylyltransferase
MIWGAIVLAAGRGTRFGRPKQLLDVAGIPLAAWAIRTFAGMAEIAELVVVTEPAWIEPMRALAGNVAPEFAALVVTGGASRQESVRNGLAVLPERCEAVLVHDGARPLVLAADVRAGMREVRAGRGALLAAPVVDTIKEVDPQRMTVVRTLERRTLWAAQTPQFAMVEDFERAHVEAQRRAVEATDDVALLEAIGIEVVVVPGSSENFKVTLPEDLNRAEVLLRKRLERAEDRT